MQDESVRPKYLQGKPKVLSIDQRFRIVIKILRDNFPPNRPVKMRRKRGSDKEMKRLHADGYTHLANADKSKSKQYFLIVINRDMDWHKQLDAIMHEWAHAMTWDAPSSQDHNRDWAHAYGKLYRKIIED